MLTLDVILHPTDFSERSGYAFRLACMLARDHAARLIVLHVWSPPTPVVGEAVLVPQPAARHYAAAEEKLRQLQAPDPAVRVEHRLDEGDPALTILRVAEESKADLIVMGTHGRAGLGRLLMGSVAEQVVRRAACPVVTVKTPSPEAEPVARAAVQEAVKR